MGRDNRRSRRDSGSNDFEKKFGGFSGKNFSSAPRKMHKTVCADCKEECEVPFEPKEDRPVYCRDCFSKHKPKRF